MALMVPRAPEQLAALSEAIGTEPERIEERILDLGGRPPGLGAAGADRDRLDEALDAILQRPELGFTPDPPGREELAEMIERAW
jgi:alcohol dehydrogenase class IV